MRKPVPRAADTPAEEVVAGVGASPRLNLAFPQLIAGYDAKHDPRTPILSPEERQVFVDNLYQNRIYRRHQLVPATCRATGSVQPTSITPSGCRR